MYGRRTTPKFNFSLRLRSRFQAVHVTSLLSRSSSNMRVQDKTYYLPPTPSPNGVLYQFLISVMGFIKYAAV